MTPIGTKIAPATKKPHDAVAKQKNMCVNQAHIAANNSAIQIKSPIIKFLSSLLVY